MAHLQAIEPSDLAAAMGRIGDPEVVAAIDNGFKVINAAGKKSGVLAVSKELAQKYQETGAKFIGVGVDAALLANATKQLASQFIEDTSDEQSAGY